VSSGIDGLPTDLSSARLLRLAKRPPQTGWRRLVYVLSGKLINPGESPADIHRRELIARINAPLLGCHKIALLSLKGGVGKTTMTATLGASFASLRGDRVVTILRWNAPLGGRYTAVSQVPAGLAIESASRSGVEVSTDGGRSWRRLDDPDAVPRDTTHLRWRIGGGEGRLSYRAVVR